MLDIELFIQKINKKSRLIGIDPGGKRIGIAISDENKIVAIMRFLLRMWKCDQGIIANVETVSLRAHDASSKYCTTNNNNE